MPGLSKKALFERVRTALEASGCELSVEPASQHAFALPIRLIVRFPSGLSPKVALYIWTVGHGGRARPASEYRIQAKLLGRDQIAFSLGMTVVLGYYVARNDTTATERGIGVPVDMEVFAAWDALARIKVGASSSCQIGFDVLHSGYLAGTAEGVRRRSSGEYEYVLAFRPEYLAKYLALVASGSGHPRRASLDSRFRV